VQLMIKEYLVPWRRRGTYELYRSL